MHSVKYVGRHRFVHIFKFRKADDMCYCFGPLPHLPTFSMNFLPAYFSTLTLLCRVIRLAKFFGVFSFPSKLLWVYSLLSDYALVPISKFL